MHDISWWQAVILGLVQGIAEFLPISSSGHLALAQSILPGFSQPGVVFDALLHVGTSMAILVHERKALRAWLTSKSWQAVAAWVFAGMVGTAVVAFPLKKMAIASFESNLAVGIGLVVTGFVLIASRFLEGGELGEENTGLWRSLVIGVAQGLAIFPGISRSGSTIVAGLGLGLDRIWVARYSFLLSVPAILGASLLEVVEHRETLAASSGFWVAAGLGAAVAACSGYVAISLVLKTLGSRSFYRFSWYCLPLGIIVIVLSALDML